MPQARSRPGRAPGSPPGRLRPRPWAEARFVSPPCPLAKPRWIRRSDSFVCQGRRRSGGRRMAELHLVKGSTKPSGGLAGRRRFPEQARRPVSASRGRGIRPGMRPGPGRGLSGSCARRRLGPRLPGSARLGALPSSRDPPGGASQGAAGSWPGPRGSPAGWAPPALAPIQRRTPAPFPFTDRFSTPSASKMMLSPDQAADSDHSQLGALGSGVAGRRDAKVLGGRPEPGGGDAARAAAGPRSTRTRRS